MGKALTPVGAFCSQARRKRPELYFRQSFHDANLYMILLGCTPAGRHRTARYLFCYCRILAGIAAGFTGFLAGRKPPAY